MSQLHIEGTLELEARVRAQVETIVREVAAVSKLRQGQLLVIGTSTSEVLGAHIGTSGSLAVARSIYEAVEAVRAELGFYPVYQCCEHLNRALVLEREALERYGLDEVSVVPVPKAGGSMAAYAFSQLREAVVVEEVQAHAGLDIGGTLIGMHLKRVAVPFKTSVRHVGEAFVQAAYTRPKLIGGVRAVYEANAGLQELQPQAAGSCD
ncbi:TIGR01440 family protein [Paenibacillus sp. YYML68]|uniref:TIGR01440 family protein n=1 Tax=Paenibacillus sp. YYML68 TaxID=2909250 RepID=UPI002490A555|nr:TIGR01440 family protein [Paenibacillus sp. YYML68]